jgi:hypothetical protein
MEIEQLINVGFLILGLVIIPFMIFLWIKKIILDRYGSKIPNSIPNFMTTLPGALPPAFVLILVNSSHNDRDLASTVLDLASRGILRFDQNIEFGQLHRPVITFINTHRLYPFEQFIAEEYAKKYSGHRNKGYRFGAETHMKSKFRKLL